MKKEENPVYEKMEKIPVYFLKNNAGTWRSNGVVPDVPVDYVGRPPRLGKMVALLLTEEACRMWEARQQERGNFFLQNAADLGRACAVSRCWILLEGIATRMRLR